MKAFAGSYLDEVAKIYSNLVLLAKKMESADKAIRFADKAFELVPTNQLASHKFLSKILFNKADAMMNAAVKCPSTNLFGKGIVHKYVMMMPEILKKLEVNPHVSKEKD